ncbi:MAG TPA: AAA family ATPase, partial [Solirubrobacterales bacterium]|nr:AAA family ATPase [Solirubrobacterales bacterium]
MRERLTSRLKGARLGAIWAAGGCGKSALAGELRDTLGIATIEVRLDSEDSEAERLVGRFRRALRRAGRSDALALLDERADDPDAAMDSLLDFLVEEREPVLLVADDVHHADKASRRLLADLAQDLPEPHRLLLIGRESPLAAELRSQHPDSVSLDTDDLAFTQAEVADLARRQGDVSLNPEEADAVRDATGGWAAAVILAIGRLAAADDRSAELRELTEQRSILTHLVGDLLSSLDVPLREGIVQLAHLPLISPDLGEAASRGEAPDLFSQAMRAGVPLTRVREGWWELAGGVQEALAEIGPIHPDVARQAAEVYLRAGEIGAALTVLMRAKLAEDAAGRVAELPPERLDRIDYAELAALVEALPPSALEKHPRVLVHLARACEPAAQLRARDAALARAEAIAGVTPSALKRELEIERGRDLVRDQRATEADLLAIAVLADVSDDEIATRARALDVRGRAAALRGDDESLREAEELLGGALVLCHALGQESWAAQVSLALADRVLYARGQHDLAIAEIDGLLSGLVGRSRYRAVTLSVRASILIDCGRFAEAEASFAEMRRLIDATGDERAAAYLAWTSAQLHSLRGEVAATQSALREVESHLGDWFDQHSTGAEFLAEAADLSDRVGDQSLARGYLARARERADEAELAFAIAEAATLARTGDPEAGRHAVRRVLALPLLARREAWRMRLLDASAAARAGHADAGAVAAQAFDEAAALGPHALPLVRERAIAERLLPLAEEAGSSAAARLKAEQPALEISLLGRFAVRRAGVEIQLPDGKPRALVKLVAMASGRIAADEAVAILWPEANEETGRKGLRNVLHRLRASDSELLVRSEDSVELPANTRVDLVAFERDARAAL